MAIVCQAVIRMRDAQNRVRELKYFVPPPADFGPGVDLPTGAHLTAVLEAIVNASPVFSTGISFEYGVEVMQNDVSGLAGNGDGSVPMAIAAKTRSAVDVFGPPDRYGVPSGIEFKIPGVALNDLAFNVNDRNVISTVGGVWVALRAALVAIGWQDGLGNTITSGQTLEDATLLGGKMSLLRPK
jgi:hypothetical protein